MREYHKTLNTDPDIKAKRVERLRSPEVVWESVIPPPSNIRRVCP
jgi:hypothetical protein